MMKIVSRSRKPWRSHCPAALPLKSRCRGRSIPCGRSDMALRLGVGAAEIAAQLPTLRRAQEDALFLQLRQRGRDRGPAGGDELGEDAVGEGDRDVDPLAVHPPEAVGEV